MGLNSVVAVCGWVLHRDRRRRRLVVGRCLAGLILSLRVQQARATLFFGDYALELIMTDSPTVFCRRTSVFVVCRFDWRHPKSDLEASCARVHFNSALATRAD